MKHHIEISFLIVCEMDRIHNKLHYWNQLDFGKMQANIQLLQGNGATFDNELIQALAQGDENHPRLRALAELSPLHFKLLNEALDHIFELAQ